MLMSSSGNQIAAQDAETKARAEANATATRCLTHKINTLSLRFVGVAGGVELAAA